MFDYCFHPQFSITALNVADVSFFNSKLSAQPAIEWQKSIGGSETDFAHTVQQTSYGVFIIAGYSNSKNDDVTGNHGFSDYCIVKLGSCEQIKLKIEIMIPVLNSNIGLWDFHISIKISKFIGYTPANHSFTT